MRKWPLILAAMSVSAFAQEDPNVLQMKKIYSKFAEVLTVGNNQIKQGGSFLVLASPGYLLDPNLDPDGNVQDRVILNALIEKSIEPDWIYRPRTTLTSEVYRKILTFHQAPEFKLSPDKKAELDKANKEIYRKNAAGTNEYTVGWNQYTTLRDEYAGAIDETQTWMNANPGKPLPAKLNNKLTKAKEDYLTLGEGTRRAALLQRKREWEAFDPETWWAELTGFFDGNVDLIGGRPYPRNLYYPKYATWIDPKLSWTKVSFSQKDFSQTTTNGSTSSGGGLGASYGLFSIGGSASGSSDWKSLNQDVSSISVSFEVLRVNIERPWMDTMVFYSNAWRWGCGLSVTDKPVISDGGDPSKGQQLTGIMPLLPTGMLVARNLKVSMNVSSFLQNTVNSQSSAGGSVSFGPFSLGGSRKSSNNTDHVHATATGTGVSFAAPQIIGFFVEVLPKTPNPLPSLKFQKCDDAGEVAAARASGGVDPQSAPAFLDKDSLKLLTQRLEGLNPAASLNK